MSIAAITFMQNLSERVLPVFDFMIIDFGSSGLQVSVFHLEVNKELQSLSHAYTREMSGEAIDNILLKHFQPLVQAEWENKQSASRKSMTPDTKNKRLASTMKNLRNAIHRMKSQTNI